jgi:hypothetical protein
MVVYCSCLWRMVYDVWTMVHGLWFYGLCKVYG